MSDRLYIAASGALARLRDLEVVANNLANLDTVGFKRDRPSFHAVLESSLVDPDARRVPGAAARAFASIEGASLDLASGSTFSTGSPLDAAIRGPGFFELETPNGPRYTRAGSFQVSADGQLVSVDGLAVAGESGPLQVGPRPVELLPSGDLVDDQGAVRGRLRVVDFAQPEQLVKEGASLYRALPAAGPEPLERVELEPGSLERSNVEPVRELASLIALQRAFDAAMRLLSADDQATQRLIQEVSG